MPSPPTAPLVTILLTLAHPAVQDDPPGRAPDVVCASRAGERQTCSADTRRGVRLLAPVDGAAPCELGKTWGYDERTIWVADGCSASFALGGARRDRGDFTPGGGFTLVDAPQGALSLHLWAYIRYLNQRGLDTSYVDALGLTRTIRPRDDLQLQKVNLQFTGWALTPKLRYLAYVWTANVSQGLGAQVIVAGNLNYAFNRHVTLGGGIGGLPGTRSTEGTFPYFLPVDNRLIADAFFQPSYTTGVWVRGEIARGVEYFAMLGNNLSQLGVDAGQLRGGLDTFAAKLSWMPTTGEFGPLAGFGDFDAHARVATRLGAHYTRSDENRQNQPDSEGFENAQIRLSNGGIVFTPGVLGDGVTVTDVQYQMAAVDAGAKYRGLALETEYYFRWLTRFRGIGTTAVPGQYDHGFQVIASAMAVPRTLQGYVGGGRIDGEYGDPSELRAGVNWYPARTRAVRWNVEWLRLRRSPVGALALPYVVGGNGSVFEMNLEINF